MPFCFKISCVQSVTASQNVVIGVVLYRFVLAIIISEGYYHGSIINGGLGCLIYGALQLITVRVRTGFCVKQTNWSPVTPVDVMSGVSSCIVVIDRCLVTALCCRRQNDSSFMGFKPHPSQFGIICKILREPNHYIALEQDRYSVCVWLRTNFPDFADLMVEFLRGIRETHSQQKKKLRSIRPFTHVTMIEFDFLNVWCRRNQDKLSDAFV